MKEILDDEKLNDQADESTVNRLLSTVRYAVCGFMAVWFSSFGEKAFIFNGLLLMIGSKNNTIAKRKFL